MGEKLCRSHKTRSDKFGNTELAQSEPCPLCRRVALLEQDHDHVTDLCRGRVCHSCNLLIGRYDRPIAEIQRFLDYLTFWADLHARHGGRSYTEYMRELFPHYGQGRGRARRKPAA